MRAVSAFSGCNPTPVLWIRLNTALLAAANTSGFGSYIQANTRRVESDVQASKYVIGSFSAGYKRRWDERNYSAGSSLELLEVVGEYFIPCV